MSRRRYNERKGYTAFTWQPTGDGVTGGAIWFRAGPPVDEAGAWYENEAGDVWFEPARQTAELTAGDSRQTA